MLICPNCKATLTCGCQKRKASDGVTICSNCVRAYESKLSRKGVKAIIPDPVEAQKKFSPEQFEEAKTKWSSLFKINKD